MSENAISNKRVFDNIHHDYETIKLIAYSYARKHGVNYSVIMLNPSVDMTFDERCSTYEFVTDSYFSKERRNVIVMHKTGILPKDENEHTNFCSQHFVTENREQYHRRMFGRVRKPVDKPITPTIISKKIGRNDNCPCGKNKKYKFCCLNKVS